jgi:hypothetical protein
MHYLSLPGNTGRFLLFPLFEGVAFIAISCRESAEWESKPRTLSALKLPPAKTQAGTLTSARDSAGIGWIFAAALIESETTQLAPASAMQIALPAQLK